MTSSRRSERTDRRPLDGAVALVTGATSGLGHATALQLPTAGAEVALLGRSEPTLRKVADMVAERDARAAQAK